jgi:hypothetical protein
MDQAILVKERVTAGQRLIESLRDKKFGLTGACWAKLDDDSGWLLFLISPDVATQGVRPGYTLIRATLSELETRTDAFERIDPLTVRLVSEDYPLAAGVLRHYSNRHPDSGPTWHMGDTLSFVAVERAYIYPATLFHKQPAGAN